VISDYRLVAKSWQTPFVVLLGGCLISLVGFGARSSYGLYLGPMTFDLNWTRETFALAMALQNLFWGICLPLAGILVDRYGPLWVVIGGALIYALGTFGMTWVESSGSLYLAGGILVGTGVAFTSFSLVTATMVRVVGAQRRSLVMGLCTAAGSVGQVLYSPITQGMISNHGWSSALVVTSVSVCLIIPLAFMLPNDPRVRDENVVHTDSIGAMREAFAHRGFLLLTAGFFVCGFHVAFITVHLPVYVSDLGLGSMVGAIAISLIGIFNIAGSLLSGVFGQRFSKKWGLSGIYAIRAVTLLVFLICRDHGAIVAIDGSADSRDYCPGVWNTVYGDSLRICLSRPPDRQLYRCLDGWLYLRPDWIVRSHVASGHHIGSWCGVDSPADKRTACPTTAGGMNYAG